MLALNSRASRIFWPVVSTRQLASHNYMLKSGGDGFVMFKTDKLLKDSVMIDNAVLINYIVDELGGNVSKLQPLYSIA